MLKMTHPRLVPLILVLLVTAKANLHGQDGDRVLFVEQGHFRAAESEIYLNVEERETPEEWGDDSEDGLLIDFDGEANNSIKCPLDANCMQTSKYCVYEGCCSEKMCSEIGICTVAIQGCVLEALTPEERIALLLITDGSRPTEEQLCLVDPECKTQTNYCTHNELCCATKSCDQNDANCWTVIPYC